MLSNHLLRSTTLLCGALLSLSASAQAQVATGDVFLEQNGLVAIHFESTSPAGAWDLSSSTPGWTNEGYFRWSGPNLFTSPGQQGVFYFDFQVFTSGVYTLYIRNRHEHPDPTEENDVWVKMDSGSWNKIFSNGPASVGSWTWESRLDNHSTYPQMTYNLSAGVHRIWFSGRSHGFKMDRVHLALSGAPNATNENVVESPRRFGEVYCTATPNSTGARGEIEAIGYRDHALNDVTLFARDLPVDTLGYFVVGDSRTHQPVASSGNLCVGATVGRYVADVLNSGSSGSVELRVDLTRIPRASGFANTLAGDVWNFQYWHRDTTAPSNFTRAIELRFE